MKRQLEKLEPDFKMPTIFIGSSDYITLGAMQAFIDEGYKIPEDVSFIGFDNVLNASIFQPQLTSINIDYTDISRIAVEKLIRRINNPKECYTTTQILPQFIK